MSEAAAFFDLDKTIIARSSTLAFSRAFFEGGLITRRSALRSAYAQFVFSLTGVDERQMERMRAYLSQLSTGWDVQTVQDIVAETLHTIVDPLVYEEAVALIENHRQAGRDVVIVSTSGSEVVEPIGEMLGVQHVIATRMVVEDGRYSGEIGFYAYGANKATAMRELAEQQGYDLDLSYAYSDSETDVPMLAAVGHAYAVNPDRALRRVAADRGWQVLRFSTPVELRARLGLRSRPAYVAVLGMLLLIGVVVLMLRLRRAWRHGWPRSVAARGRRLADGSAGGRPGGSGTSRRAPLPLGRRQG